MVYDPKRTSMNVKRTATIVIIGGAFGYNGFVSNPLGRVTSLGLRAKF